MAALHLLMVETRELSREVPHVQTAVQVEEPRRTGSQRQQSDTSARARHEPNMSSPSTIRTDKSIELGLEELLASQDYQNHGAVEKTA
ncbi:Nn.00g037490.m01.CDS01 [Neocucurbitaria sp. VM-36]